MISPRILVGLLLILFILNKVLEMDDKHIVIKKEKVIREEPELLMDGDVIKEEPYFEDTNSDASGFSQMIPEDKIVIDYKHIVIKKEKVLKEEPDLLIHEDLVKEEPYFEDANSDASGFSQMIPEDKFVNDGLSMEEKNYEYERVKISVKEELDEDLEFSEYSDVKMYTQLESEGNEGNFTESKEAHYKHSNEDLIDKSDLKGQNHKYTMFQCDHCDKTFNHMSSLKTHLRIHTGEKPFKCDHCGKSFNKMSHLKTHLRIHTGEKPFKCDHCDKSFNTMSSLKRHLRIHTGEKPFKCDHCDKDFSQLPHLKRHLRIHTEEKPFKCDHCDKCFNNMSDLRRHLIIHAGEKPFKCDYCDKSFNTMSNLKRHLAIHTGEKPFKCDY